jgi:hypothetical protein
MFFAILARPKYSSTKLVFVSVYNIIIIVFVRRGLCFCMSLKLSIKLSMCTSVCVYSWLDVGQ